MPSSQEPQTALANPTHAELKDFERLMDELQSIVTQLEKGDQTLEQSLSTFERGVTLTRICQNLLDTAEQRVQVLLESGQKENWNNSAESTD